MTSSRRHGGRASWIQVLLVAAVTSACSRTVHVTPWFRLDAYEPLMDQPFRIGDEARVIAWMKKDGQWVEVSKGGRVFATPSRDGGAVLFHGKGGWMIARERGDLSSLAVQCSFPALHPTKPLVYCARCANAHAAGNCVGMNVTELDLSGKVTRAWTSAEPTLPRSWSVWPVGVLPDESIAVAVSGTCRLLSVGPSGTTALALRPNARECTRYADWRELLESLNAAPLVTSGESWQ